MLLAAGTHVHFCLWGGSSRRGKVLLHDESGSDWPASSGLVVPAFNKLGLELDDDQAQRYYGSDYVLKQGSIRLPDVDLTKWRRVARVKEAFYTRLGDLASTPDSPKKRKNHKFKPKKISFFSSKRGELPVLYARGRFLRIELGDGAVWNWRGIVSP